MNSKHRLLFAAILLVATGGRAVSMETALFAAPQSAPQPAARATTVRPVRLREVRGRGLLADVWVNSFGPFIFAVDTGAGATLVSPRLASAARLDVRSNRSRSIAGLSGRVTTAHDANVQSLAIGDRTNYVPGSRTVVVTPGLPNDIDGVLDPTEAFSPLGYIIDIPRLELSTFDSRALPLRLEDQPREGAVVRWLRQGSSHRPFVQLDNGDRALIDTGSSLGLGIRSNSESDRGRASYSRDIGGGQVSTQRVRPMTVAIGALKLKNIPTDVISGAEANAPTLLGLSALRPFRLVFDPVNRLIEIAPTSRG
ncbi:MAG: retroviral-like aspartic protease family protein [Pyrinomonadaceae bacterium]